MKLTENFRRGAENFVVGVLIGGVWLALSFCLMLWMAVVFPGSIFSTLLFLVPFGAGNIPIALGFSFLRKHHVASGVLTAAILASIWMAHHQEQQALYGVQQSGKTFTSAAKQHFRHVYRGE